MTACNHASIVVDAPMDLVWEMTNDVLYWPTLFPDYAATEVLATAGGTTRVRVTMRPDERGGVHGWTAQRVVDPATRTVVMHQVSGHAFAFLRVLWRYREVSGGVRLDWTHEFQVDAAMPYDDHAMVQVLQRTVPRQLDHLKQCIEVTARERAGATAPATPFRVWLRVEVRPGAGSEFEREWLAVAEGIARHEANTGQWLQRSAEEDDLYFVLSEWTDEADFRRFEHSAEHRSNRRRLDGFRRGGSMQTMTLVRAVPGAPGDA